MSAPGRALVYGFRMMGRSMAGALVRRGSSVVVVDDHPSDDARAAAVLLDVPLVESPSRSQLRGLVTEVDAVLPSPGVPDDHPVFAVAREVGKAVLSEYDLARRWDHRPVVAVTGTDGKTTVTTLVRNMLEASGVAALACGNNDLPLVEAIERVEPDVFVVEASSFQLGHTQRFEPLVAAWLNFAPDHLDVHASIDCYEKAKSRIWAHLPQGGVAVANADDPVVIRNIPRSARVLTFGVSGDLRVDAGTLRDEAGVALVDVDELPRRLPHDVSNALAAAAIARAAGATIAGVRQALLGFQGLPHRVELVGSWQGTTWYDDSKATVPHATLAALRSFDHVVLIAGGRNKGLDLAPLRDEAQRVRAVVAIGEAADEVGSAFDGICPVRLVDTTMADAVDAAAEMAAPGDVVLLSPGCASFDWFDSYHERGKAYQEAVRRRFTGRSTEVPE